MDEALNEEIRDALDHVTSAIQELTRMFYPNRTPVALRRDADQATYHLNYAQNRLTECRVLLDKLQVKAAAR